MTSIEDEKSPRARILVMDDEELVRSVAQAMLTRLGYAVELAVDGDEAVRMYSEAMAKADRFDVVIVDLTVPSGMGGVAAAREILKLDPEASVIISSGFSNDPIMTDFAQHGFCAAIVKPYQMQELSDVVERFAGR